MRGYWEDNGWVPPSQEWAYKLAILLRDSITLLKDAIDQSKPFFFIPKIQKEGLDFLENEDSKASLELILNYLNAQNIIKLDKEKRLYSVGIPYYGFILCLVLAISLIAY